MKHTLFFWILLLCASFSLPLAAISIVYNFRIAQITKQPIFEASERKHSIIALLFDQFQKKYNGVSQNFGGGLCAFIYNFGSNFFRTDFAVSHIHEVTNHITTFSGTETDDLLFTMGREFLVNKKNILTLSGLFGVPTHKVLRLQHVDFGYGQIGTGIQLDGSCACTPTNFLLYGARYIYYVPRKAHDNACQNHTFTIGNTADVLLALNNKWDHHGLEVGFTERWQFGAHARPHFDEIVKKTNYIRSNLYAVYKYKFLTNNVANRFLFNISYGFDNAPKIYGNKYIITVWASWNIRF